MGRRRQGRGAHLPSAGPAPDADTAHWGSSARCSCEVHPPSPPLVFAGESQSRGPSLGAASLLLVVTSRSRCQLVCGDSGLTRGLNQHLLVLSFSAAQLCFLGALMVAPVPLMACPFVLGPQYGPAPAHLSKGPGSFYWGLGFKTKIRCGGPSEPSPICFHPRRPARGPGSSFWEHLPICPRGSREAARAGASRSVQTRPGAVSKHCSQGPSGWRAGAVQRERPCPLQGQAAPPSRRFSQGRDPCVCPESAGAWTPGQVYLKRRSRPPRRPRPRRAPEHARLFGGPEPRPRPRPHSPESCCCPCVRRHRRLTP